MARRLLDPKKFQELTDRYAEYLEEIIDRLWIIIRTTQEIKNGNAINEYPAIDLELCYLQLRKSFECVMFASLLAHRLIDRSMTKEIEREYHAGRIIKYVKRKNATFFPKAVVLESNPDGSLRLEPVTSSKGVNCLTEKEFLSTYDRACAERLHADHTYDRNNESDRLEQAAFLNTTAISTMALLAIHKVTLAEEYIVLGLLNTTGTGKPSGQILSRIR